MHWTIPALLVFSAIVALSGKLGIMHMAFATLFAIRHVQRGMFFALEHPLGASSWALSLVGLLRRQV